MPATNPAVPFETRLGILAALGELRLNPNASPPQPFRSSPPYRKGHALVANLDRELRRRAASPQQTLPAVARIPIKCIELHRVEGSRHECIRLPVYTFDAASIALARWAHTAPDDGSYHKCDFTVTYTDGETYKGRIDLERRHFGGYDVKAHMRRHLMWLIETTVSFVSAEQKANAKRFLETYDVCPYRHDSGDTSGVRCRQTDPPVHAGVLIAARSRGRPAWA